MKSFKPFESKLMLVDNSFNDTWNSFFRDFGSFSDSVW
jgi:hypothetical protein